MRRSFDNLARAYRWLERLSFGRALEAARFAHLSELAGARSVLVLGEGDGRFLERLLAQSAELSVDVVDKSAGMLAEARRRTRDDPRVSFHHADVRAFEPTRRYDAIVTCFFLDCFEAPVLDSVVERLAAWLVPGGLWLYADFVHDPSRVSNRLWLWLLYAAFGALTDIESRRLDDPRQALERAQLQLRSSQRLSRGLLVSELWQKTSE